MICERCKKRQADFIVAKESFDGETLKMYLCDICRIHLQTNLNAREWTVETPLPHVWDLLGVKDKKEIAEGTATIERINKVAKLSLEDPNEK